MKKRTLTVILAFLMLSSTLASCGGNSTAGTDSATGGQDSGQEENEFQYIDDYVASISSEHNFNGADFNIVGRKKNVCPADEGLTGTRQNDALYYREREAEAALNVKIEGINVDPGEYDGAGMPTALRVQNDVLSKQNSYDLVEGNLMTCGRVMLNLNVISPVEDLPGLDLNKSWWLNNIKSQLSIGEHLFFLTGKMSVHHYSDPAAIFFNKKLIQDYSIGDPYALVNSGEWTLDKMVEIASAVPADSGVYRYLVGHPDGFAYYVGGGYSVAERDADGNPTVPDTLPENAVNYIEKCSKIFGDFSTTYNYMRPDAGTVLEEDWAVFTSNRILFWCDTMGLAEELRKYNVEFGILPVPKSSTDQKDYISLSSAWSISGFFVPMNVKDEAKVGYVTEVMAALSEKYIEPVFYEKSLRNGSVFDADSKEMLDIIYHTKKMDLADIYQWGYDGQLEEDKPENEGKYENDFVLTDIINHEVCGTRNILASAWASNAPVAKGQIARLLELVASYD